MMRCRKKHAWEDCTCPQDELVNIETSRTIKVTLGLLLAVIVIAMFWGAWS